MQARSEETRTHILSAALKEFANHGYNAASVDEICASAGVSKGAFYHHFAGKQAIFLELLENWLAAIDAGFEAAQKATVPETLMAFTEMLPGIFASADGRLPMFVEFWLQASRNEAIWAATNAPYERYQQYFANLVERGKNEGSFRANLDSQTAARGLVAMAVGLLLQSLLTPRSVDWEIVARQNLEIFLKGLN